MNLTQRESLRDLLQRVDDVRGLGDRAESLPAPDSLDLDALLAVLHELVRELEASRRRLIETNIQLVSLREVASRTVNSLDAAETARLVARYLSHAFGLEECFLMLLQSESGRLEGSWAHLGADGVESHPLELPLVGDYGAIARALWLGRTVVHHAPRRNLAAELPDGHPLHEILARLGSTACVPLRRSSSAPDLEPHAGCEPACIVGDAGMLVPPPGPAGERWLAEREERQRRCLTCEYLPLLGVIGTARRLDAPPLSPAELTLLESIAISVAPLLENAQLHQELRRSQRFRDNVLDSMASALVAVNMGGQILTFNRAAEELLGFAASEVLGQPFGALIGSDGEALLRDTLEHGREVVREETMLRARNGSAVPVHFTTSLLRDDRRFIHGAIAVFVDLTPLKQAEEQVRRMDRLAALGRFTSGVAHEIRNPLAGIGAGIQYLARNLAADEPQRRNLDFILGEIRRLDRIVQDLFDVTHPRRLQPRVALLEDTLRRAVRCLEPTFRERSVEVRIDCGARVPPVAHDVDQMEQVFINLLKNAAEASPAGAALDVKIAARPPRPGSGRRSNGVAEPSVTVHIEDRGLGIRPEHLKTLFEPFFTTKPGGTGLGLYISHDIVKRHGGSLTVTSEPALGTTLTVELPLEPDGGDT